MGDKMKVLNGGKNWYSALNKFSIIETNERKLQFFFNIIISLIGDQCDCSSRASKILSMPQV